MTSIPTDLVAMFGTFQTKVQQEIDQICGNRSVMLADKPLMPFTEATVNEVLRHSCLVYTIPHSTTDDLVGDK